MFRKLTRLFFSIAVLMGTIINAICMPSNASGNPYFFWPVDKSIKINCGFGEYAGHQGMDFACSQGTPIFAAASGIVKVFDNGCTGTHRPGVTENRCQYENGCKAYQSDETYHGGWANYIEIEHGNGYYTRYAHMLSGSFTVSDGEWVEAGDVIGKVSNCGNTTGYHLHFEVGSSSSRWTRYDAWGNGWLHRENAHTTLDIGTDFWAFIKNTASGKTISNDSNNVSLREDTDRSRKLWHFERLSDGSYKITSAYDGNCMEVWNMSTEEGANVQTLQYNGNNAQQWYISGSPGAYVLRAKCSGMVLDVNGGYSEEGTNVQMWTNNGSAAQLFTIEETSLFNKQPLNIGGSFYGVIRDATYGKTIYNSSDNSVRLKTATGDVDELWHFELLPDNTYAIRSAKDGFAMEMYKGNTVNANPVVAAEPYWGGGYQRWYVYQQGESYVLHNHHWAQMDLVLDLQDGNSADGTSVITYPRHNESNQLWTIYAGDSVQMGVPTLSVIPGNSISETVFTWDDVQCENGYNIKIYSGNNSGGTVYYSGNNVTSGLKLILPAGQYYAYVESYNALQTKQGVGITFTVQEAPQYTITYNANGGSNAPASQMKQHGADLTLTSGKPDGKAYTVTFNGNGGTLASDSKTVRKTFTQWNTKSDGSGTAYASGGTYKENNGATLYAQWDNATLGSVTEPTRTGYLFGGWYDSKSVNSNGNPTGNNYTSGTEITKNTTLYAMWLPENALIYGDYDRDRAVEFADEVTINQIRLDKREPDYNQEEFLLRCDLNRDREITQEDLDLINELRLDKTSQLEFAREFASASVSGNPKTSYGYEEALNTTGLQLTLRFKNGTTYKITEGLRVTGYDPQKSGTQTLTVQFHQFKATYTVTVAQGQYTVTYDTNGGTGAPEAQVKNHGVALKLSEKIPSKFGYNFSWWSDGKGEQYQPGDTYTADEDLALQASWNRPLVTVDNKFTEEVWESNPEAAGNGEYFGIRVETPTSLWIYDAGEGNSKVSLYDSDGNLLATDDNSGVGEQFELEYSAFTAGKEYIVYIAYSGENEALFGPIVFAKGYQISYVNNYGDKNAPEDQKVYYGAVVRLSDEIPVRKGYDFKGWSADFEDGTVEYKPGDSYVTVNGDVTLYAVWETCAHTYGNWTQAKAPTCTVKGSERRDCTKCDHYETRELALADHTEEPIPGKEATCEGTGLTEGKKCSVCDKVIEKQETIPAKGHKEETVPGKEATCEGTGLTEGKKCSVCGKVTVKQDIIAAKGHDWGTGKISTLPTKENPGVITYTCTSCGKTKEREIPALGTDYIAQGICGDQAIWTLDVNGVLTISGTGAMYDFDMGESPWYAYRGQITEIMLSDGLTYIGDDAFRNLHKVSHVTIPEGVTEIGSGAFITSGLTSVTLPEGLKTIGSSAFSHTKLETVDIPDSVVTIKDGAFSTCDLEYVRIPADVKEIGAGAFAACGKLRSITVDLENTEFRADAKGVLYSKDMTVLHQCPGGFAGEYVIPTGVETLEAYAFDGCTGLTKVTIPDSVTYMRGQSIFSGCTGLRELVLPDGIKSLSYAFAFGANNLETVKLPDQLEKMYVAVFYRCSNLTSITIPEAVTEIGSGCFGKTGLTSIYFRGSAPEISEDAFEEVTATAYYPTNDPTWTEAVRQNYGGEITWRPYCKGEHVVVEDPAVESTCSSTGLTAGSHCSVCGEILTVQTVTEKKAHVEVTVDGKEATCTETGLTEGKKCSVCGKVTKKPEIIPLKDHAYGGWIHTVIPNCTETGKDRRDCTKCDHYEEREVPAGNHTEEIIPGKPATCVDDGLTEGKQCGLCGAVIVEQEVVPATGIHIYTNDRDIDCNICGYERPESEPVPDPEPELSSVPMFRMYDPNSGEHFYTGAALERDFLVEAGWHYEGVGFNFPVEGTPVYRLYEPVHGEHLYTMDQTEANKLLGWGWQYEGVAFNSAGMDAVPQYRLHNPNAKRGGYHFTGSEMEREILISAGWIDQGIGWYSCKE